MKLFTRVALATALAVPLFVGIGTPAQAESAPGCSSTVQIGSTATVVIGGQTFASVKQFKGCGKNWGYLYVWQSWRNNHGHTDACVSVADLSGGAPGTMLGTNCLGPTDIEVWSFGTNTLADCTWAVFTSNQDGVQPVHTDERC